MRCAKWNRNYNAFIAHERWQSTDSTKYPLCVINLFRVQCGIQLTSLQNPHNPCEYGLSYLGKNHNLGFFTTVCTRNICKFLHASRQPDNRNRVSMTTYAFLLGTRVGEADNPGPMKKTEKGNQGDVVCAVCNPHAILSNKYAIMALEANVVFVSETSATNAAQCEFQKNIQFDHYNVFWSKPVGSKFATTDDRFSLRGEPMGTAVLTNLPHRKMRGTFPDELFSTCRVACGVTRIANIDVLTVSIYGYAKKCLEGRKLNDLLLARVYDLVTTAKMPFIIGGDMNEPPTTLPSFDLFRDLGAVEAFAFSEHVLQNILPPTCKDATYNDTMIFHPMIVPFIKSMEVRKDLIMDVHSPLRVSLHCKLDIPVQSRWQVPLSWADFPIEDDTFFESYKVMSSRCRIQQQLDNDATSAEQLLREWSKTVEKSVDRTLQIQHMMDPIRFPCKGLPRSYCGRCAFKESKLSGIPKTTKVDKHTKFEPPEEIFREHTKRKVKQVRRIRSLLRAIWNAQQRQSRTQWSFELRHQLLQEWWQIKKAQGYPGLWGKWILSFECVHSIAIDLPLYDDLYVLAQITEHDCNIACKDEAIQRKANFKRAIQLDMSEGSGKMVYSMVRDKHVKTIQEIPYEIQCQGTLTRLVKGHIKIQLHSDVKFFQGNFATFGEKEVFIVSQHGRAVTIQTQNGPLQANSVLKQTRHAITADEIANQFHDYWAPIWLRESRTEEDNPDAWQDFLQIIENIPIPDFHLKADVESFQVWKDTVRHLKNGKAPGIDFWRPEELKLLPDNALFDLKNIFSKKIWQRGMPPKMMIAKTVLIAKSDNPKSIADGRPITILATLARLASKILADQLLTQLASQLPWPISGGLPQRGSKDLMLQQQYTIEQAVTQRSELCGYTLDLAKAFNKIPRYPLKAIFSRFKVPQIAIHYWFKSLKHLVRYPHVKGTMGKGVAASSGVPEGDACSVLAMVLMSSTYYYMLYSPVLTPYSYADNWTWMTTCQRAQFIALQKVFNLITSLRMQIDHNKSWSWGTTKSMRAACRDLNCLYPDGTLDVPVVETAKDLGYQLHYNQNITLGSLRDRIKIGVKRCMKLRWIPISMEQKAKIIQTSVWPNALFGAENQLVGKNHFRDLRRAACTALMGDHKQASSIISCNTLFPGLQDPLMFVIIQSLRSFRRIYSLNPQLAMDMYEFGKKFQGRTPFGPCGSLKKYLHKIGWSMNDDGYLDGPKGLLCHLFSVSSQELNQIFKDSWTYYCYDLLKHRKGVPEAFYNFSLTSKVFRSFEKTEQAILALNMTGGYQTGSTRSYWLNEEEGLCEFCGAQDGRHHRMMECCETKHIRDKHPNAVETLGVRRPGWVYLPIAHEHKDVPLLRLIQNTRAFPQVPEATLQDDPDNGSHLTFWTDGACKYPTDKQARMSAWAVIQDTCENDNKREALAGGIKNLEVSQVGLRCAATGLTAGKQSASRAELSAIVAACTIAKQTGDHVTMEVHTDAQYACNVVANIVQPSIMHKPHKSANFDLVSRLQQLWSPNFHIRKVKAHRKLEELSQCRSLLDRWGIIANHVADQTAGLALKRDSEEVNQITSAIYDFNKNESIALKEVLEYYLELNIYRIKHNQQKKTVTIRHSYTENGGHQGDSLAVDANGSPPYVVAYQYLCEWNPPNYQSFLCDELDDKVRDACSLGSNITYLVWEWLKLLKWPSDVENYVVDASTNWGISYFELLINFQVCTNFVMPIPITSGDRYTDHVHYFSETAYLQPKSVRSVSNQVCAFEKIFRQIENLSRKSIIPKFTNNRKKPCLSLARLGFEAKVAGLPCRPILVRTKETMEQVKKYLYGLKGVPKLDEPIPEFIADPLVAFLDFEELDPRQRANKAEVLRRFNKRQDV